MARVTALALRRRDLVRGRVLGGAAALDLGQQLAPAGVEREELVEVVQHIIARVGPLSALCHLVEPLAHLVDPPGARGGVAPKVWPAGARSAGETSDHG